MNAIDWVNQKYHKEKNVPHFKAGDTVKVHVLIKEGDKERVQVYEGVVIAIHRNGASSTFTVRKISYGMGVERIFPYSSPHIAKIEVSSVGKVRRAKLYYLRDLSGKKARIASVEQFGALQSQEQPDQFSEEVVLEEVEASKDVAETQKTKQAKSKETKAELKAGTESKKK